MEKENEYVFVSEENCWILKDIYNNLEFKELFLKRKENNLLYKTIKTYLEEDFLIQYPQYKREYNFKINILKKNKSNSNGFLSPLL